MDEDREKISGCVLYVTDTLLVFLCYSLAVCSKKKKHRNHNYTKYINNFSVDAKKLTIISFVIQITE